MSARKSINKSLLESPTSDASSTASSTRLATTRASASAQQQQAAGSSDAADPSSCDLPDSKRRRRTAGGATPTTPTITSLKKSDENDDNTMSSIDDADDDRSVKSLIDDIKLEEARPSSRTSSRLSQSPLKKPTVFDKSRIVTRKVALDFVKNNTRALRGGKRNSKEISKGNAKEDALKKRVIKKVQVSPSVKRKRDSKCEDKDLEEKPGKLIKIIKEEIDDTKNNDEDDGNLQDSEILLEEENFKLFVDEVDSKDDELVEVVQIKGELDEETEDTLLDDECTKSSDITDLQKDADSQEAETVIPDEIIDEKPDIVEKIEVKKEQEDVKFAAYERPRRGRPKKIDLDCSIGKRTAAKKNNDKQNTPETSSAETKTKAARAPSRASSAAGKRKTVDKPKDDLIKTEDGLRSSTDGNDVQEPLTVDTSNLVAPDKDSPSTSSGQGSEKAASLSPELISEGVNVISVKQFYKKPEFLENNLGIENDPNLGEIVQKVEKVDEDTSMPIKVEPDKPVPALTPERIFAELEANTSGSGDSIKEGELLVLEDSTDDSNRLNEAELDEQIKAPILTPQPDKASINLNLENIDPPKLKIEADVVPSLTISSPPESNNITEIMKIICDNKPIKTSNIKAVDINKRNSVIESDSIKSIKDKTDNNVVDVVVAGVLTKCEKKINKILPQDLALALIEAVKGDATISNETRIQKTEQMDADSGVSDVAETIEDIDDSSKKLIEIRENVKVADDDEVASNPDCDGDDDIGDSKKNLDDADSLKDINEKMTIKSENAKPSEKKLLETPETLKQKENHFKSLGLLTHKAAVEAKIEKQRRRKLYQSNIPSGKKNGNGNPSNFNNGSNNNNNNNNNNNGPDENGKPNGGANTAGTAAAAGTCNKSQQEYTGTLKTVIKLNRQPSSTNNNSDNNNKRKSATSSSNGNGNGRQSLKMTFQKGRGRGIYNNNEKDSNQSTNSSDDTYYTIQNETENVQPQEAISHGRKLHNRSHTSEVPPATETPEISDKKEEKEIILIPEKASSFSIHPGRLCQDQCFYCGGRFGLYDTPCHVAQLKSVERQQKILENEEKLTVDNCLCDACFRHVDRRANVPSYKKRLSAPATLTSAAAGSETTTATTTTTTSTKTEQSSEQSETVEQDETASSNISPPASSITASKAVCFVPDCNNPASHSLRRKVFRKTIRKILPHFALSSIGSTAPICSKHYESVLQFLGCSLCKRRLGKNHAHHIYQDSEKLEKLLGEQGIPVKLGINPAVCKLCKYFTNLLLKPPDGAKIQKKQFVKNYRRRLLHFHNIKSETPSDTEEQGDDKSEDESRDEDEEPVKPKEIQNTSVTVPGRRGRKKKSPPVETIELEKDSPTRSNSPESSDDCSVSITGATSGQMMLDNDVMVDYDVPVIHDSPSPPPAVQMPSKLQTILQGGRSKPKNDISSVLRSNPNISMRELFPGEEEMGLQVKVPFGSSSSQRTPEGWTRVQTFLQYDDSTKRLWEELQKPYGNQSSFLRHLILLEKYFRNGDLILSPNAHSNATVYSNTVQNRLKSYDNNDTNTRTIGKSKPNPTNHQRHMDKIPRLMSNLPVTITAKPKLQNSTNAGSSSNSSGNTPNKTDSNMESSILKTNLLNNKNIEILPINSSNDSSKNTPSTSGLTIQQKLLAAANKLINSDNNPGTSSNQTGKKLSSGNNPGIPPQLISINRNQNNASTVMSNKNRMHNNPRPGTSKSIPPNVIVLPDTLSPIERMQSKNWRPTLIPVSSGAHLNQMGPLYQTAEGRRLPGLVQVQSGGRPFLISIHDYNRMCIMRREKLLRDQMLKTKNNNNSSSTQGSSKISNNNLSQNKLQIPNKLLEQNSVHPVGSQSNRSQQQQKASTDQKNQLPQPMLVKTSNTLVPIAPKPPQPQLHMVPQSIASAQHTIVLGGSTPQHSPAISIIPNLSGVLTLGPPTTANSSTSWLWTSTEQAPRISSVHQNNKTTQPIASTSTGATAASSSSSSSASSSNSSSPSVLKQHLAQQPQLGMSSGGVVLDNSLLSKIPKSLTVIPQQKSHRRSRGNSAEDLNSA